MGLRIAVIFAIAVAAAAAAAAGGQDDAAVPQPNEPTDRPPAAHSAQDTPIIRVDTRLVEIEVVVRDKNGPVTDLEAADFEVFDKGQPQTIAAFSRHTAAGAPRQAPLPPGTVSNRVNASGQEPVAATILLIDRLNTSVEDQSYLAQQALKYLRSVQPGDQIAVYSLWKYLRVLHDFTSDTDRLIAAVAARAGPEQSVDLAGSDQSELLAELEALAAGMSLDGITASMMRNSVLEAQDFSNLNRANNTEMALEEIARHLQGMPGRKKLVWISGSFAAATLDQRSRLGHVQIEGRRYDRQVERAAKLLNEADVAVYPVDPRPTSAGMNPAGRDTMNNLARLTGGKTMYGSNDITSAIRAVMHDTEVTYTLAFYPSTRLDGNFHDLDVKVKRSGVEVRHRQGYFATDQRKTPPAKDRRGAIEDAFEGTLEATGVGLTAAVLPIKERPGVYLMDLTLDARDLRFEQEQDKWVATVELVTAFPSLPPPNSAAETLTISLTQDRLAEALRKGYQVSRLVNAGDIQGELRMVVQDHASGQTGSIRVHIGGGN